MSDDYEVGYGKPPRQHRFAPGNQAASKKKRKAGKSSVLLDALDKAVNQRMKVKRGDQFVTLSVSEIYAQKLVQGMTTGTVRDRIAIFKLLVQHAPRHCQTKCTDC